MKLTMNSIKILFIQLTIGFLFLLASDYLYTNIKKSMNKTVDETKYRIRHKIFHHSLQPKFDGWGYWFKKYRVCTDANGFKHSCDEVGREEKHFDIGFVGDSFVEGIGLPFEKTFVGMFSSENPQLKIANLGVANYSPSFSFVVGTKPYR